MVFALAPAQGFFISGRIALEVSVGVRPTFNSDNRCLSGSEGELVSIRVSIEPRFLEDLLEALAQVSFPVNPQIYHGRPTAVEFPAYEGRLEEIRNVLNVLKDAGLDTTQVQVCSMLDSISVS